MFLKRKSIVLGMVTTVLLWGKASVQAMETQPTTSVVPFLTNHFEEIQYQAPNNWNQRERKVVYITFDDGPSVRTQALLEVLEKYEVPATFFFVGTQVEGREEIIKEVDQEGHYVGLHSISHSVETLYNEQTPENLSNELIEMQGMMEEIIGKRPVLFRPPYGSMPHMNKKPIIESLVENKFKCWDWTVDTYDWNTSSASSIIERVKQTSGNPVEVVLLHEKQVSVEALPGIIEYYQSQGYEFRAYDESLHMMMNFMKDERL